MTNSTLPTHPKIGILGGGQLARMLVEAQQGSPALRDVTVALYCTNEEATRALAVSRAIASLEDTNTLADWGESCSAVTFESENINSRSLLAARGIAERCWPSVRALEISQDRRQEKRFFEQSKIPIGAWCELPEVFSLAWCTSERATLEHLLPGIVKTATAGYDGKGQTRVSNYPELISVLCASEPFPRILEKLVPYDYEVSQVSVRGRDGDIRHYPLVQNAHHAGILSQTVAPAHEQRFAADAQRYVTSLAHALEYVGVLAVEFFVVGERLLANEWAPRVHNSGHWSIEGALTSQFENHLRAVAGLPLGECGLRQPFSEVVMWNIIGASYDVAARELASAVDDSPVATALHWYGKSPRSGRKVGHIFVGAESSHPVNQRIAQQTKQFQILI